ncbi:hypothetical protein [Streptomyces bacillaris]|uniref:hypothetical protein n=1 Tax=Streptomyces bacillaris TaxID=68179 RepID=UPI0038079F26
MSTNPPDPDDLFRQYDSFEDPDLRSDFLDAIGTTRPYIDALRDRHIRASRRSAAAEPDEVTPQTREEPLDRTERKARPPRLRKRSRAVATTRPPNNNTPGRPRNKRRRRRERPSRFLVIIIRLD